MNLACSIILLWPNGNISLPARNSYWSTSPDINAHIFDASLVILHCNISCLILASTVMIRFYILSKILSLKREDLPDARTVPISKIEFGFAAYFL